MYFSIFYKNFKIDWVLSEFYEPNTSRIIAKIIDNTVNTKVISYGNLLCKDKGDLDIICNILTDEYNKIKKQKEIEFSNLPNLINESIKQFISQSKNN